jgi:hypothetical protein
MSIVKLLAGIYPVIAIGTFRAHGSDCPSAARNDPAQHTDQYNHDGCRRGAAGAVSTLVTPPNP